jgi:two-component system, chemotaxis family, CheB/CheR fusion protein
MNSGERTARPSSAVDTPRVVAVASSAGDLEAPSELVSALPAEYAAAFIVVQHLCPGREKLLAEALAERTNLPVMHAHDGLAAEHGHIYVIPANTTLTMTGGRIRATPVATGLDRAADILFISLAQELGRNAVGVILSGGGSDGAIGIRAIRQGGGTTFAQHPGSARFPEMPISAIETGCVDFVLRPNEIARELAMSGAAAKEKAPRGAFRYTQVTQAGADLRLRPPAIASSSAE